GDVATLTIPAAAAAPAAATPQTGDMASLYALIAALFAIVLGGALLVASRRKRHAAADGHTEGKHVK
ncbi:MAG: LPXTG cell wall anchor domain-containing protein, partial [Coriobacteriales bacterium]|nr:LPXTG cell wall anchor domain-containing protein [Coriobacteriales bacterium]